MKTIMTFAVALACGAVFAQEEVAPAEEVAPVEEVALVEETAPVVEVAPVEEIEVCEEEESEKCWSVGVDADLFSAYVWRHAVQNDQMVFQPAVWTELNLFGPLSIGGFIWQNWDLTHHRTSDFSRFFVNETDYNLHFGLEAWASEEEECKLVFEFGHDWFTYYGIKDRDSYPETREFYVKATFENPLVNVYGQCSWMYQDFGAYKRGCYYEAGLNKEIEVEEVEGLTLGVDWSVGFGDKNYNDYLYAADSCGINGTTVKTYASYALTDWVSIKGTLAYSGLVNAAMRKTIGNEGDDYDFYGSNYPRDLLWGGVSLNFEF